MIKRILKHFKKKKLKKEIEELKEAIATTVENKTKFKFYMFEDYGICPTNANDFLLKLEIELEKRLNQLEVF